MIKLQVIGRLGRDAEIKQISDKTVINFSIATDVGYGDKKQTLWLECSRWTEQVGVVPFLKKGQQVYVDGEPSLRTYKDKEGNDKTSLTLRVNEITLVGGKSDDAPQTDPVGPVKVEAVDDLPF